MNENQRNETLVKNIRTRLDTSLDDIDAATQSKITRARHRALEQKSSANRLQIWLPASVVATACLALVIASLVPVTVVEDIAPVDDFELISNIDDLELLEELEFYEWLEDYELPT